MNLPTVEPIKNIVLLIAISITCVALAGCGNKGPLVKPTDIPAAAPVPTPTPAAAEPVADKDLPSVVEPASGTPAAQR